MVYRQPAEELLRQQAAAAASGGPLARLEADGRKGTAGARGTDGAEGRTRGENGDHGRHAGQPTAGSVGGDIRVVLETASGSSRARLHGALIGGGAQAAIDQEIDFSCPGDVVLEARGGRGGNGGEGGNGGDGARGRKGRDATRYTSGSDGGRGGDGGDAGNGTHGAPGGNGGRVVVRVAEVDTHLLMLVASDVRGGRGGKPGANGAVGSGGAGGEGGDSYSWTTSESYTDSSGRRQTRTETHRNSGGSRGPRGRDGRASHAMPAPGRPGADGTFAIEVESPGAELTRHERRYDVRLVSFKHRNENDDGVYEPEEKVLVTDIEVENVGGMPTPAHHDIVVGLADSGWIAPADVVLRLPRALRPGQRHVFTVEELALTLRLFRPQASSEPLVENETIHLFAELPDVKRRFDGFETEATHALGKLVVRFPVTGAPLTSLFSLAPGQAARVRWSVTNVSDREYGRESVLGRAVSVYLGLARQPGLDAKELHFFDDAGRHVPLDVGFRREIPRLAAGATVTFEGTLAVAGSATTYASGRLFVAIELGRIDAPLEVRPIQYRDLTVRVGRPFEARDADVLLVANNRTTEEELRGWEELASRHRLTSAVWDAALEGGVDVLREVAAGTRRYRLVVILNNLMDTPGGEKRPGALLDQATSLALARAGVHVTYVGKLPDLAELLVPTHDASPDTTILADDAEDAALVAACEAEEIGGPGVQRVVEARYAWPWSHPAEAQLLRRAEALARLLEQRFPQRRYVVAPRYEAHETRKVAWVRTFTLGHLTVRRTLDPARSAVTGTAIDDARLHANGFADDAHTRRRFFAALPFAAKVALLEDPSPSVASVTDDEARCDDPLVAAVLGDLLREQVELTRHGWRAKEAWLAAALPMLEELARDAFGRTLPGLENSGTAMARLVELVAWLDLVARDHVRLWEWAPPLVWLRRGPVLRGFVRRRLDALVLRCAGSEAAAKLVREAVATRRRALRKAWKARAQREPGMRRAAVFTAACLARGHATLPLESDALHLPPGERVIAQARFDELRAKERSQTAGSREVIAGARRARTELLREESCESLLAQAGVPVRVAQPLAPRVDDEARAEAEAEPEATVGDLRALLRS